MVEFLDLYEVVQKIDFQPGDGIRELERTVLQSVPVNETRQLVNMVKQPMSDKELVVGLLFKGIGGMMVEDSKRDLATANSRVKQANVVYSQAETLSVAFDAIIKRAERTADVLAKVNLLFRKSIKATSEVIERNGSDHRNYNIGERKMLMNCMNLASTIKQILDAPMLDNNGKITEQSLKVLNIGDEYLKKINEKIY